MYALFHRQLGNLPISHVLLLQPQKLVFYLRWTYIEAASIQVLKVFIKGVAHDWGTSWDDRLYGYNMYQNKTCVFKTHIMTHQDTCLFLAWLPLTCLQSSFSRLFWGTHIRMCVMLQCLNTLALYYYIISMYYTSCIHPTTADNPHKYIICYNSAEIIYGCIIYNLFHSYYTVIWHNLYILNCKSPT